jgi:hypothetical protein
MESQEQYYNITTVMGKIPYIEKLVQTPIYSGRVTAVERILCPYFIRRLTKDDACQLIKDWIQRCLALPGAEPMSPTKNWDGYVEYYLDWTATHNYFPLKLETVKFVHADLYDSIMRM